MLKRSFMETNFTNSTSGQGFDGEENEKPAQKKAYLAPQIRHFGSVTDLTQNGPGRGADGCTTWADCTS
jgi:hypothetical protein